MDLNLQTSLSAEIGQLRDQLSSSASKFRQAIVNLDQAHQEVKAHEASSCT